MTLVWMSFLAFSGLSGTVLFFAALRRWPLVGVISIAVSVTVAWEIPHPPALLSVAGTSIYFMDLLSLSMLTIAAGRLSQLRRNLGTTASLAWIGLGLLLIVSLALGLAENPFGRTMNEFRSYLYPYAAMTWAMSLTWDKEQSLRLIRNFSLCTGWLLVAVAACHFMLYGVGSTSEFVDVGTGIEQTTRPLISGQAFMLFMCGIVCIWFSASLRSKALLVSGVFFFAVVVLSQQRTVWAVAAATIAVVFLIARTRTRTTLAIGALWFAWLGVLVLIAGAIPPILVELEKAAFDSGTYDARVRSWRNLISHSVMQGPEVVLFGQPMGSGFGRYEGVGRWVEFAPHNWYVTIYLRVGVLGLSFLIMFLARILLKALMQRENMATVAITTAVIIYGWSYSWPWYICLLWGWAISQKRRVNAELGEYETQSIGSLRDGMYTSRLAKGIH